MKFIDLKLYKTNVMNRNGALVWFVYGLSTLAWLISNIHAPKRYSLAPLVFSEWHMLSIAINLCLLGLLLFFKQKKFIFFPIFYMVQPIAYGLMYLITHQLLGTNYQSDYILKFWTDILFFILEILLFLPFLIFQKEKNPFRLRQRREEWNISMVPIPSHRLRRNLVYIGYAAQMGVVLWMTIGMHIGLKVGLYTFFNLLGIQMIFSLLLGLKEEFIFRWVYLKNLEKIFGNIWIAAVLQTIPWATYHVFFGEGIDNGLAYGLVTIIGSMWFSVLVYEFKSIILATLSHALMEVFAFYMMYAKVPEVLQYFQR